MSRARFVVDLVGLALLPPAVALALAMLLAGCGSVTPAATGDAGNDADAAVIPDADNAGTGGNSGAGGAAGATVLPDAAAPDVGGDGAAADTSLSCLPGCVSTCGDTATSAGCAACTHPDGAAGIVCGCGPIGSLFCCCWTGSLEHCTSRVVCQ